MDIKKIVMIVLIAVVLFTATLLIIININSLKKIPTVPSESKEESAAREEPELNYAIPAASIPARRITEITIAEIIEKRKALQEKESEAKRARSARRSEAFAHQKALEASLLSAGDENSKKTATAAPTLPQKEIKPPSSEEIKAMEKRGIISY